MSAHANPDIVDDSLVFIYDTDDGKSFKGEPTVNLATDSPSQGGWAGGREVLDSSRKKFKLIVNNFNGSAGSGQGWRSFTWDLNSYSGQSVTISATVEVPSASPGTFAWIMMGQGNTHTNSSGAGGYMGYSATSERVQKTTTTTEHITWTGTVGSTGTASQPSGHVGFTLWYNGGTIGVDSYVEVSNVQIEINSHATQFVNGTRSATQGLLDRTGTSTIDISDASFDSNAQMTFDGTDDYALTTFTPSADDNKTISIWVNFDTLSSSYRYVVGLDYSNATDGFIPLSVELYNGNWVLRMRQQLGTLGTNLVVYSDIIVNTGEWINLVISSNGSAFSFYKNGVKGSAVSGTNNGRWFSILNEPIIIGASDWLTNQLYSTTDGKIANVSIYNKQLTDAEILQNFNATKSRFDL